MFSSFTPIQVLKTPFNNEIKNRIRPLQQCDCDFAGLNGIDNALMTKYTNFGFSNVLFLISLIAISNQKTNGALNISNDFMSSFKKKKIYLLKIGNGRRNTFISIVLFQPYFIPWLLL